MGLGLDTVVLRFLRVGKEWLYWSPTKQAYVKITKGQGNLVTKLLNGSGEPKAVTTRKPRSKRITPPTGQVAVEGQ